MDGQILLNEVYSNLPVTYICSVAAYVLSKFTQRYYIHSRKTLMTFLFNRAQIASEKKLPMKLLFT